MPTTFTHRPRGPFGLSNQTQYFGDWLTLASDPGTIVLCFPVEGWKGSAAVAVWQLPDGQIEGRVHGRANVAAHAQEQALACLSLDVDGEGWAEVGRRDPVIGQLQSQYGPLRPVLFYSPYEAAAAFVIGHRRSIAQRRTIMSRMAEELGEHVKVEGQTFHAFPGPQALLDLKNYQGLNDVKVERLHGVAHVALAGLLDRTFLRSLAPAEALERLQEIPGIGPFFAQGILNRGAGLVDEITTDDLTFYAMQKAYRLPEPPDRTRALEIAEAWRPFRMWATVLLHVWVRREVGLPRGRNPGVARSE